jgi:predicted neutral ceramidase superfamily lipid hydrolase
MEQIICPNTKCKEKVKDSDEFCPNCKYPLKGTEKEKSLFVGQQILKKDKVSLAKGHRKVTKYILIFLGVINLISLIITWTFNNINPIDNYIPLVLGFVFISLAIYAEKKPLISISVGLGLLLILYISNYLIDPDSLLSGIKFKIMIIGIFIYGLVVNIQAQKIQEEHKNL